MTFKALCEVVRSQGIAIRELEKQISSKASKSELNSGLNIKANVADVMRTFSEVASNIDSRPTSDEIQTYLEDKISKSDIQYYLSSKPNLDEVRHLIEGKVGQNEFQNDVTTMNTKIEEINKDFSRKFNQFALAKDLSQLSILVEGKANVNDVNEALNTKASKESVINALHRKANKNEIEATLNSKVDIAEFQSYNHNNSMPKNEICHEIERIHTMLESKAEKTDLTAISNSISIKSDSKDFELLNITMQEIKRDLNKRVDEIDQDIDRLIDNIKKEFQNLNVIINSFDSNYKFMCSKENRV